MHADHWYSSKLGFIGIMMLITACFFMLRLGLIRLTGWDAIVNEFLDHIEPIKVGFAICVPPLVDLLQSLLLVMTAKKRGTPSPLLELSPAP